MNKQPIHRDVVVSLASCDNCVHTFREKDRQDVVVCIQQLKTVPSDSTSVCDLHSTRERKR